MYGRAWLAGLVATAELACAADDHCRDRLHNAAFSGWRAACAVQRAERRRARSVLAAWSTWCKVRARTHNMYGRTVERTFTEDE